MGCRPKENTLRVELLSGTGGGRDYSYSFNLHYRSPEPGEVVIVPFAGRLYPAVVLQRPHDTAERRYSKFSAFHLRPVIGIERTQEIVKKLSGLARGVMDRHLRPAAAAFSHWLPAPFEREFAVFFFART